MSIEVEERDDEELVGQTLANRYQIESRLGEGAMGAVYRAKHVKVGRAFAVKVLHPRLLEDKKVLQRFEREAELAGRLRHPNVIGVVDVGVTPSGMHYMVMDFAEGPDLASLLSEAPMPPQRVIHLTRQMLEGLFHAHEQGLIHRDFKPENVIVERDSHGSEVPRIVDFGIAILREGGESSHGPGRLTTNGLVLGTPHYMAPEQAVADPIDHRIDLFALGIMVYEMLCGKLPFDGTGAEVARANLLLDPPPISERVPYLDVDPLLEAFARRMMAKKRDQRPATAKAARDILDLVEKDREAAAAALGVPLEAARPPMSTQPVQPVRKHTGDGTFPPPIREAMHTPAQAPAMTSATAVRVREQSIATMATEPLGVHKRKAPLIAALVVGVGILGGAGAVLLMGGDKDAKKTAPGNEVAVVTTDGAKAVPTETPTPVETGSGSGDTGSGAVVSESGSESGSGSGSGSGSTDVGSQAGSNAASTDAGSGSSGSTASVQTPKQGGKTGGKTGGKSGGNTGGTKAGAGSATTVVPAVVVAPKAIDAGALASQYKAVGAQLKALEDAKGRDATSDLWARYRFIRISDAMTTQQKRDDAAAILSKLTSDITARKK